MLMKFSQVVLSLLWSPQLGGNQIFIHLSQPLPFDIDPQPSPVVRLITDAVHLCRLILCVFDWNITLADFAYVSFLL